MSTTKRDMPEIKEAYRWMAEDFIQVNHDHGLYSATRNKEVMSIQAEAWEDALLQVYQEHDPNFDEKDMPELDSVTWEEPEPRDRFLDLVGTNVARIMYEEGVINAY